MTDPTVPDYWTRQSLLWGLAGVTNTQRLLLLALDFHGGDKVEAWPSQDTLARKLCVGERQVRKLVTSLEERDLITVRRAKPNRYQLNWNRILESGTPVPVSGGRKRNPSSGSKRNSSSGLNRGNRNPSSYEHPACEHPKNTHRTNAVSGKRNGWEDGGITLDELRSPKSIQTRFDEAVSKDYCLTRDRLRFFTLAIHVGESSKVRNHGALFTKLLKDKSWSGTGAQEDAAGQAIRQLDHQPSNVHVDALAAHLRADFPGGHNHE